MSSPDLLGPMKSPNLQLRSSARSQYHHQRPVIKSALVVLLPVGIIAGFQCIAGFYSINLDPLQNIKLARAAARQGLWLISPLLRNVVVCERGEGAMRHLPPESSLCMPDYCRLDDFTPWDEWKACKSDQLAAEGWVADEVQVAWALEKLRLKSIAESAVIAATVNESIAMHSTFTLFDAFIIQYKDYLPWQASNHTAVLVEFRYLAGPLNFSITNVMNNLPAHWRLQVVGGATICDGMNRLFPAEVAAGKIVLTDIGDRPMQQSEISAVLTDLEIYSKLLGDTWLFFQYDSAICSKQRHLLKYFIARKRGWWGAPWGNWTREPKVGGNGGFSLRAKRLVYEVLQRFPWHHGASQEDWYICNMAADMYEELPEDIRPATFEEEMAFSSETMYSEAPFGVHHYWYLDPMSPRLWTMFNNCPEMWGILNTDIFDYDPAWRSMVCQINVTRSAFVPGVNITFDFAHICAKNG